jgi:hypothetical protein
MITSRSNAFGCGGGQGAAHPILRPHPRIPRLPLACRLALVFAFLTVAAFADGAGASFPSADTLLNARLDNDNWILPVVTQTMPLTAPGALTPDEYAAIMAFLLSYDCVQPAGDGQQPFPTTDLPSLQQVEIGSATCAATK